MSGLKVSIIIPCYNGEKYLREAIISAMNQTYADFEIIIVDDGSTDNSLQVALSSCYDPSFMDIIPKDNEGPASALNVGIRASSGDFIKWLSADDVLYPDAVQTMIDYAKTRDYQNSIFYTNYHIIDENGSITSQFIERDRTGLSRIEKGKELLKYFYGNGSTSLIHRSIFERCGMFDESLKHSEDYEYWLRCTLLYGINLEHIPVITLKYRNHADQLTKKVGGSLDDVIRAKILNALPTDERALYV